MNSSFDFRLKDGVAIAAVLALGAALWIHRTALNDTVVQYEQAARVAMRASAVDLLMGQGLPPMPLIDDAGNIHLLSDAGRDRIVWLLNPAECPGCLEDVREWNALVAAPGDRGVMVLLGVTPADGARLAAEAGIRGKVLTDSLSSLTEALQLLLPTTLLAVDGAGIIRMADARSAKQGCNWSLIENSLALRRAGVATES